jgi:hypothetical protein
MDQRDILSKKIQRLSDEAIKDFELNELNISEKSMICPTLKIKWLHKLFTEQALLKKAEELVESKKIYAIKNGDSNLPQFQREMDYESREDTLIMKSKIVEQREVIRFIEGVIKVAATFNFDLKNSIDYIKLSE